MVTFEPIYTYVNYSTASREQKRIIVKYVLKMKTCRRTIRDVVRNIISGTEGIVTNKEGYICGVFTKLS